MLLASIQQHSIVYLKVGGLNLTLSQASQTKLMNISFRGCVAIHDTVYERSQVASFEVGFNVVESHIMHLSMASPTPPPPGWMGK